MNSNLPSGRLHSIESFGTVDGPGIRMVVFLQGCPLRCRYCHNPDTWDSNGGEEITVSRLLSQYQRNRSFYAGITVSGGEPTVQLPFLTALFSEAKKEGIHTCLDTSGILFREDPECKAAYDVLLACTDLVMLDIKHIFPSAHKALTGQDNAPVKAFAAYVSEKGIPLRIRHVLVPGITDRTEDLVALGRYLSSLRSLRSLEVLPYHTLGRPKYEKLGIRFPLPDTPPATIEQAAKAKAIILSALRQAREE